MRTVLITILPLPSWSRSELEFKRINGQRKQKKRNGKKRTLYRRHIIHWKPSWQFHSVGSASLYGASCSLVLCMPFPVQGKWVQRLYICQNTFSTLTANAICCSVLLPKQRLLTNEWTKADSTSRNVEKQKNKMALRNGDRKRAKEKSAKKEREMTMLGSAQAFANHTIHHSNKTRDRKKHKKIQRPFNVVFYVEQKIDH